MAGPAGFFPKSLILGSKSHQSRIPKCGACGLYLKCKSPKMETSGKGRKRILLVGDAPSRIEDETGKQFAGRAGELLEATLNRFRIDMRNDCWMTNSLICHPVGKDGGDGTPNKLQVEYCRPNLIKTVEELKPELIILLGDHAVKSLIGWLWKNNPGSIDRWQGWEIPSQSLNAWVCPTWSPTDIVRNKGKDAKIHKMFWERDIQGALRHKGRPWETIPDYKKQIDIVLDTKEAAELIYQYNKTAEIAAFDFETNMLRPDWDISEIASASICWDGQKTIAFPWEKNVIKPMKEFIRTPIKKIASNKKMEDRWCRKILGLPVRNWWWDTMDSAHVLDNRREITGLKFQSFVQLGFEAYDEHIKPLLKATGDDGVNQVLKEIDLRQLLLYNGLDSLLEYLVCFKQIEMKEALQ